MIYLKKLFDELKPAGIADDSRKVKDGFIFVAIRGQHSDGNDYIDAAIQNGALAIVSENARPKGLPENIRYQKVNNARKALAFLASEFYGNPSKRLKIIGVTGSDGKTTTSHMIYEVLKAGGKKVGLISTISAKIGNKDIDTGFHVTNPEPLDLHKFLSEMIKKGLEYVVLETTSHGLAQERVYGINYEIAVLTNITHEHLDYHKTFENYRDTKLKMFLRAKISVLNKDDKNYEYFNKKIKGEKIVYSSKDTLNITKLMGRKLDEVGEYNLQNARAAVAVSRRLKISLKDIKSALENMSPPMGRLEEVKNNKGLNIYIDFAHTPNALKEVLTLLRNISNRQLIVVFGCAGERDSQKRPMMAEIATSIADISIFTAEDPRSEQVNETFKQMEKGIKKKDSIYHKIPERGEAITFAINKLAKKGDTVVICGKAHERSMAYNGVEYPWSDFDAVELALKGKVLEIVR